MGRGVRDSLVWAIQVLVTAGRLFVRNELGNHAAAVAFYFLLSLVPILLVGLYVVNALSLATGLSARTLGAVEVLSQTMNLEHLRAAGLLPERTKIAGGGIGLIALVWASRRLLGSVQSAFRVIFADSVPRSLWRTTAISLLVIPGALVVLVAMGAAQALFKEVAGTLGVGPLRTLVLQLGSELLGFATLWGLLLAAYHGLPSRRVPIRLALWTAALAALSILALQEVLGYLLQPSSYRAVYGSVGKVIFVLLWVYVVALVFFYWAQVTFVGRRIDAIALERLLLVEAGSGTRLDQRLFGRTSRLVRKYGRCVPQGGEVMREGETSQETFFILRGSVALSRRGHAGRVAALGELGPGELFGEMAYLLGEPRTATVTAASDLEVLAFPPTVLEELMQQSPQLSRRIIGVLCARLRRMNERGDARPEL